MNLQQISAGEFSSQIRGHVIILNLLKRFRLLTTGLTPESVEHMFAEDSWPGMWSNLAKAALGHHVSMMEASRRDMWCMARWQLSAIDEHPSRCEWYPLGWVGMAAIVRQVVKDPDRRDARPVAGNDTTDYAEAALRYVARAKKMSEGALLESAGLTRPLQPHHETTLLKMVGGA